MSHYDPSAIVDQYFATHDDDDPAYFQTRGHFLTGEQSTNMIRYERKLGRMLTAHEGKVLMRQIMAHTPVYTPRFTKCAECGNWIDHGKLCARYGVQRKWDLCSDCSIPF